MSTYASRTMARTFAGSSLAAAVFWAALLLGRALTPVVLARMPELHLYRAAVFATIAGVFLLLSAHTPLAILTGSAFTGLALAPLFPLILALFLEEIGGSSNAGWVFGLAGLGGAVLSWLTGVVSTSTGSLRIGLLVPGSAAWVMLLMICFRRSSSGSGSDQAAQAAETRKPPEKQPAAAKQLAEKVDDCEQSAPAGASKEGA
jgi:fucose permease